MTPSEACNTKPKWIFYAIGKLKRSAEEWNGYLLQKDGILQENADENMKPTHFILANANICSVSAEEICKMGNFHTKQDRPVAVYEEDLFGIIEQTEFSKYLMKLNPVNCSELLAEGKFLVENVANGHPDPDPLLSLAKACSPPSVRKRKGASPYKPMHKWEPEPSPSKQTIKRVHNDREATDDLDEFCGVYGEIQYQEDEDLDSTILSSGDSEDENDENVISLCSLKNSVPCNSIIEEKGKSTPRNARLTPRALHTIRPRFSFAFNPQEAQNPRNPSQEVFYAIPGIPPNEKNNSFENLEPRPFASCVKNLMPILYFHAKVSTPLEPRGNETMICTDYCM